jgi:hypothetical protein
MQISKYPVMRAVIDQSLIVVLIIIFSTVSACNKKDTLNNTPLDSKSLVNTSHLDTLYEEIIINKDTMGIIHIYSEYPDYGWVDDADEGTACVDDAARAAIFYLNHFQNTHEETNLLKARRLLQFVLYMQAENGLFYNFIEGDHQQNKTYKTSVAKPDWWTWRAMWALAEGLAVFNSVDQEFAARLFKSLTKSTMSLRSHLPIASDVKHTNGFVQPTWLPYETASDQAALMIFSLIPYYQMTKDSLVLEYVQGLANGIMLMQAGDSVNFPHHAFLSWENIWHAYGNSQSQALLKAGRLINNPKIVKSALNEITNFYPQVKAHGLVNFEVRFENGLSTMVKLSNYPQIAYDIRPMVFACLEAYKITKDKKYAQQAGEIACWLFGDNIEKIQMYFPQSGICYDGITGKQAVNRNSGAESTIEALLILQAIEQNPVAKEVVREFRLNPIAHESIVQ